MKRTPRKSGVSRRLPEPPTTFFGRAVELDSLRAAFDRGQRLVTLLGPGGVGKTRLALRYAAVVDEAPAATRLDVVLCDLTEIASLRDLSGALAHTLDIALLPGADDAGAIAHLARALAARPSTLLVLDNVERLVADAAPVIEPRGFGATLIAELLKTAPLLRVLATSRVRLRISGEAVIDLAPLRVPELDDSDPESSPAVQLFVERARQVAPGWGAGEAAAVAAIVRRLDGFPLAIELCATRARVLEPASLLARLERGFDALGAGPRDVADRHASLAHAIDWSVKSLAAIERSAYEQCAVFAGGFTLEAAEAIVDVGVPVIDVLTSLVDASLLRVNAGRFAMYSAIRDHAARALAEAGIAERVEARHARYFLDLGERLLRDPDRERRRLARELYNLAAVRARALAAAADREQAAVALHAALVIDELLEISGPFNDVLERIDAPLRAGEAARVAPDLVARGLTARGSALRLLGRLDEAVRDHERAVAVATSHGERKTEARARLALGVTYRILRRTAEARATGEEAVAICRAIDAPRLEARARNALEGLLLEIGDVEGATRLLSDAEALVRRVGDRWAEAMTVASRGHLAQERGDLALALASFERAIPLYEAADDGRRAAIMAGYRAAVLHERRDYEAAFRGYRAPIEQLARYGNPRFEGFFRAFRGAALAGLGRLDEAREAFDAAERVLGRGGDPALLLVLEIHRLHLEIDAERSGSEALARSRALTDNSALVASSDDVRLALRILHRAIEAAAGARSADRPALVVALQSRWFQPPGGARTSLQRKQALWLVLQTLADARLCAPGSLVSSDMLLAAGWPDERILPTAGAHRVRVAVATLRDSGLRGILLSRSGGYLIDPAAKVELLAK